MGVFQDQARDKLDWTDQDLLTFDEAEERLVAQQVELRAEVDGLDEGPEREIAVRRLDAVGKILEDFRARQAAAQAAR